MDKNPAPAWRADPTYNLKALKLKRQKARLQRKKRKLAKLLAEQIKASSAP